MQHRAKAGFMGVREYVDQCGWIHMQDPFQIANDTNGVQKEDVGNFPVQTWSYGTRFDIIAGSKIKAAKVRKSGAIGKFISITDQEAGYQVEYDLDSLDFLDSDEF